MHVVHVSRMHLRCRLAACSGIYSPTKRWYSWDVNTSARNIRFLKDETVPRSAFFLIPAGIKMESCAGQHCMGAA